MTTVVLGWDGLDYDLAEEFGVAEAFGAYRTKIDTVVNPVLDTPHTRELWPTLISGAQPDEHGIRVADQGETLDWSNPVVDIASDVAGYSIPHAVRSEIGRILRNRGADLDDIDAAGYRDRGIDTVFDGRQSCALAIPNYRTVQSETLGLTSQRKSTFREFIRVHDGGGIEQRGDATVAGLEQRLWAAANEKLGAVRAAVAREYDIVWVWLGYLDTIGHLSPAMDAGGIQQRGYKQAARWTRDIGSALEPEDTLVCVSDHGLQDGKHTHTAFLGANAEAVLDGVDSVEDVRQGIDRITPASGSDGDPRIRPEFVAEGDAGRTRTSAAVENQLDDLGYL